MEYLFETEHLAIRKFQIADTQTLYEIHQEAEVKKWIPNESYAGPEEAQKAIAFFTDCVNAKGLPYVLAVECKATGDLIGDTGVNEVEGKPGEVEIGYVISGKHGGKGFATELLGAMTDFVVSNLGMHVLYGRVMRGNDASVRVLEKNGYIFETEEFGAEDDPYGKGMLVYKAER